jgi:predicted ATPase
VPRTPASDGAKSSATGAVASDSRNRIVTLPGHRRRDLSRDGEPHVVAHVADAVGAILGERARNAGVCHRNASAARLCAPARRRAVAAGSSRTTRRIVHLSSLVHPRSTTAVRQEGQMPWLNWVFVWCEM